MPRRRKVFELSAANTLPMAMTDERRPMVIGELRLDPPPSATDCTCRRCAVFRARRLLRKAVAASAALLTVLALTARVSTWPSAGDLGAVHPRHFLWLVAPVVALYTFVQWPPALRRWVHRTRPRSTEWPPA